MDELLLNALKVGGPLTAAAIVGTACIIVLWKQVGREWQKMKTQQAQAFADTTINCREAASANRDAAQILTTTVGELKVLLTGMRTDRDRKR